MLTYPERLLLEEMTCASFRPTKIASLMKL